MVRTLGLLLALPFFAHAQDPNFAHPHEVLTVAREGYSVAGLLARPAGPAALKYGIAIFPGHPGILRLREEAGEPRFELRGNFLVRSRRHWLDEETLVLALDAPSDRWGAFPQEFRETPRYGEDVAALLAEASRRFGVEDWTFVGTSEGSISAFHAARMNPALARRVILTASVFRPSRNGPGLWKVRFEELRAELLWVHHAEDPCEYTSYGDALAFARRSGKPLLTVRGGGPFHGGACQAFTAHGFAGRERDTVLAMREWVKTGKAPPEL